MKHIKLYEDFINEAERVPTQLQPSDFRKYFSDIHYDTVKRQYDRDTTPEIAQANNGKWYEVSSAYNRWDERIVKLKSVKAPKNEANESTELDEALNEISLSSAGVRSFLRAMYTNADVIKKLGFNSFKDLVSYVKSNDLRDWDELRAEVEELGIVIAESEDFKVTKNSFQDFDTLNITQFDKIQFKQEGNKWIVRAVTCHDSVDTDTIKKLGFGNSSADRYAGISTYTKNANWHPLELTKKQFDQLVKTVDKGWKSHAKSFADFYSNREKD
jgi:hypothetical protein